MKRLLALAPLFLLLTRSSWAAPSCPENIMGTCVIRRSTLAADRDSCRDCTSFACRTFVTRYDIPAGVLRASANFFGEGGSITASVVVEDDFKVVGLVPGTPVSLIVHLSVNLTQAQAHIHDPRAGRTASANADPGPLTTDITLDIAALADQDFPLVLILSATVALGLGGMGDGEARLSFGGLPPGAVVVSCNGFGGGSPVPTRQTSWGRLKQLYR